ncbi:hypothetical protein GUJ93_ZPchr0007g5114 [Zizania palustris]|uniref:Succinate dehydrogenase assembly factor 4, mitochondrial n=1 Tax=Zizania palustris TaxID=103762 RepID=A0A8J5TI46_ZIZPA|nr:hypothetical protein GUJ93_ZPchr0007g5114 [Zizania palustris]
MAARGEVVAWAGRGGGRGSRCRCLGRLQRRARKPVPRQGAEAAEERTSAWIGRDDGRGRNRRLDRAQRRAGKEPATEVKGGNVGARKEDGEDEGGEYMNKATGEIGGLHGPEPTRYDNWERGGRCSNSARHIVQIAFQHSFEHAAAMPCILA